MRKCFIITFVSVFMALISSFECQNAYAAAENTKWAPSKGLTVIILILIFILAAAISAYITFKLRRKGRKDSSEINSHISNDN